MFPLIQNKCELICLQAQTHQQLTTNRVKKLSCKKCKFTRIYTCSGGSAAAQLLQSDMKDTVSEGVSESEL